MATDTALIERREELKRRLAAGEYKTLVDVFLTGTNRVIKKIIRRSQPLPTWIIALILILFVNLAGYAVNSIANDWNNTIEYFRLLGLDIETGILWKLWDSILAVTVLFVINGFIGRIFSLWRNDILNATETVASLKNFEDWLEKICSRRQNFIFAIIGGLLAYSISTRIVSSVYIQYAFLGMGFALMQIINYIINFSSFYLFIMFIILAIRLHQYDIKLFVADPSNSELIARLSGVLSLMVFIVAAFAAISTPVATLLGFTTADTLVLLFLWMPIIAMFILNQSSLSSIIRRVKWNTLNEIQMKIEKLQTSRKFGNQETMDSIKRLLDYHDRVKATHNSALDFRTYLNFINSLLLPLLAFILGNLDLVMNLFTRQP